jgi:hypothetical protein
MPAEPVEGEVRQISELQEAACQCSWICNDRTSRARICLPFNRIIGASLPGGNDFARGEARMDNFERLHQHGRRHFSEVHRASRPCPNVDDARRASAVQHHYGEGALELVEQAADLFKRIEDQARHVETQARVMAEGAVAKLQLAHDTIEELRNNNAAAEARITQLHDEVQELAQVLKEERARVLAAEERLPELERRAKAAEARAKQCESTLSRIEDVIRTKILREGRSAHQRAAAA